MRVPLVQRVVVGHGIDPNGCGTILHLPWNPFRRNRTLFGVAPNVADRWRSSNDLPLLKSNSVLHLFWSQLRHETARPQLENSARLTALRPRPSYS